MDSLKPEEVLSLLKTGEEGTGSVEGFIYCEERLSLNDRMREYPFLKLRTTKGIDTCGFKTRFGKDFRTIYAEELQSNVRKGFLKDDGRYVSLTEKGLDFANLVMEDFL